MKITEVQKQQLDALRCERFSYDEKNLRIIDGFYNVRNDCLVDPIRNEAFTDDAEGRIAYYLIKHPTGKVLFYFSLKCGLLYDHYIDDEKLRLIRRMLSYFIELKQAPDTTEEDKHIINSILEKLRSRKGFSKTDIERIKKKDQALNDIENEFNDGMRKVGETYAGIELVQFCANDEYRDLWKEYGFDQRLGVVVFWHFVVPIVLKTMDLVGCEYLFLFAADLSEDEELVNYYRTYLKFEDTEGRNTAIPLYDDTCKFMYQETRLLVERQKDFYDNFNHEKDAV